MTAHERLQEWRRHRHAEKDRATASTPPRDHSAPTLDVLSKLRDEATVAIDAMRHSA